MLGRVARESFPELRGWRHVGVHDAVFRATAGDGSIVYVRKDDGSAALLRRLAGDPEVPAPALIDRRPGWLMLAALGGVPIHDRRWLARPGAAAEVISDALRRLERNDLRHGDMCLPNILGDLETGRLSGIVDWGDAGRFDRTIDVASAIWSCGYNGHAPEVAPRVLRLLGWPRADAAEVRRLERIWSDLAGPPDPLPDQSS